MVGMKWFMGAYSQAFNARHGQRGHVFQGRYKALPVESGAGQYVETVSTYIHLNPARAKLPAHLLKNGMKALGVEEDAVIAGKKGKRTDPEPERPPVPFGRIKTTWGVRMKTTSASISKSAMLRTPFRMNNFRTDELNSQTEVAHSSILGMRRELK